MKILGIDPGLRKTGWGVVKFNDNLMSYVDDGFIDTEQFINDGDRLLFIFNELEKIVSNLKPKLIGIEKTFVGVGNLSSLKLGMARGVSLLVASKSKIDTRELAPRLIKKTITGSGNADKEQVNNMVKKLLGISPKNNDSSDALAVAISSNNCIDFVKSSNYNSQKNNLKEAIRKALLKEKLREV